MNPQRGSGYSFPVRQFDKEPCVICKTLDYNKTMKRQFTCGSDRCKREYQRRKYEAARSSGSQIQNKKGVLR